MTVLLCNTDTSRTGDSDGEMFEATEEMEEACLSKPPHLKEPLANQGLPSTQELILIILVIQKEMQNLRQGQKASQTTQAYLPHPPPNDPYLQEYLRNMEATDKRPSRYSTQDCVPRPPPPNTAQRLLSCVPNVRPSAARGPNEVVQWESQAAIEILKQTCGQIRNPNRFFGDDPVDSLQQYGFRLWLFIFITKVSCRKGPSYCVVKFTSRIWSKGLSN